VEDLPYKKPLQRASAERKREKKLGRKRPKQLELLQVGLLRSRLLERRKNKRVGSGFSQVSHFLLQVSFPFSSPRGEMT